MPYSDFTLEQVAEKLGVTTRPAHLFKGEPPVEVPADLSLILSKRTALALISEKARSEAIVAPILWSVRDLSPSELAIFSGQRVDIDPTLGLMGECDFLLSLAPAVLPLRAPIVALVEAKKNDIEAGLGQCVAQMIGADRFNRKAGRAWPIYGCVTTGEDWQFLHLDGAIAQIDQRRYYLSDLPEILGVFRAIVARCAAGEVSAG